MNIISLQYIQQTQSLIDMTQSYEFQATIAIDIYQLVYLSKCFFLEVGDLLYSSTKLSPDLGPSSSIIKLLKYFGC